MRRQSSEYDSNTVGQATSSTSGLTSGSGHNRPRRGPDEPSKKLSYQGDESVWETLRNAGPYSVPIDAVPRLSLDSGASVFNPNQNKIPTAATSAKPSSVTAFKRRGTPTPPPPRQTSTSSVSLRSAVSSSSKLPFAPRYSFRGPSPTPKQATLTRSRGGRLVSIGETIQEESCELAEEETVSSRSLARPIRGGSGPNEVLTRLLKYREEQIGSYRPHVQPTPDSSAEQSLQLLRELRDPERGGSPKDRGNKGARPARSLDLCNSKIAIHAHTRSVLRSNTIDIKKKSDLDCAHTN